MKVEISFGALVPVFREQLIRQGITFSGSLADLQADADAVSRLYVRGVLTQNESIAANGRIKKSLEARLRKKSA